MFDFLSKYYPLFFCGTAQTVIISLIGVAIGILLGLIVVSMRMSDFKVLSWLARCYVSIVRGTPAMIQVMLIYYSLSKLLELPDVSILGSSISRIIPGSIALGINSGAYTAEIFRSGIISVPKGQTEAGLSLGLDELTTMTSIVLPQAVRNVLPALCNEFISLIKESSVLFYIGVQDLTAQALGIGGTLYDFVPPLIVAAIIFFILTFLLSQGVSVLEKKMGRKYSNGIV